MNSNGVKHCGDHSPPPKGLWTCSLDEGHRGDHKAYGGHQLEERYYRATWDNDDEAVTDEEVAEAIRSIMQGQTGI